MMKIGGGGVGAEAGGVHWDFRDSLFGNFYGYFCESAVCFQSFMFRTGR